MTATPTSNLQDSLRRLRGWSMWRSPDEPEAGRRLDVRELLEQYDAMAHRLAQINTLACYASEENTTMQPTALEEIGKLARGEDTVPWPAIR